MNLDIPIVPKCKRVLFGKARYKVLKGGRGSGKSWAVARYLLVRAMKEPLTILCTREIQNSIKDSVHRLFSEQIESLGLSNYFQITKDTIVSSSGAEFIFKGLHRNITEIKSTEGVNICWVEEAEAVSEESWKVLIPTIREEDSEIVISYNPDEEKSATHQRFAINSPPDTLIEHVNYMDNPLFPEVLRKEMEYDKRVDYEKYEHVWLGMVKKYGEAVIFKDKVLIEEFPEPEYGTQFFFGADWGYAVDPTCLIRMFMKENTLYIDHEFYAVGVEINELPQAFESVPQSKKWKIVADNARPETISYLYNRGFNIEGSKKGKGSVEDGIQFLRSFEKIIIHPRCKGTIGDFKNYKWKQDKATNEILPIPVDSSNHAPDACLKRDTLVLTSKGEKKICEIKKGEEVLTRVGFKKVLWSGIVGKHAKVVKVKTKDGKSLICTPEHRILKSSCFTRADVLRYDDELLTLTQEALCKTQSNTRGRFIGDIQNQKGGQTDYIISENVNIFIEKCGKTIMEEFPEINISIIKMVTRQIIESKILNAAPQKNILVSTNGQRIKEEKIENSYTPLDILLHNGIKRQRAESFIKRLEDYLIKTEIKNIKSANFVVRDSSIGVEHPQSSAQTNVNQHGEENQESITLSQYVNIVEGLSSITNIKKLKPVQDRVLTVYDIKERVEVWDLTIQDQPEFFANRILVHNSRYALEAYIKKSNQAGVFIPDWKMPNLQGR